MLNIKFRYKDAMSNWKWRTQSCTVSSVEECKRIYGLDEADVEYKILEVKEVDQYGTVQLDLQRYKQTSN